MTPSVAPAPRSLRPVPTDLLLRFWLRRGWRGLFTLHRLHRRLVGRETVRVRADGGALFELSPFDYIPAHVLRAGYYETEVLDALRRHLLPGDVLWDIGANFGLHAVTVRLLCPSTTVIAFEPNPDLAAAISRHAALNGVDIIISPLALSAETGPQPFHVMASGNPGMSTLRPWSQAVYDAVVTIDCARGDELVASGRLPAPTVIKLDVEGGEADVLEGLGIVLANPRLKAIVFEAEAGLERQDSAHPVARRLASAGFQLGPLSRREATSHALENYLAVRRQAESRDTNAPRRQA